MKNVRPPFRALRVFAGLMLLLTSSAFAQSTIGLIEYDSTNADGYVLFTPMMGKNAYLLDKCGKEVKRWTSNFNAGLSCYLLADGSMIRAGSLGNATFAGGGSGGILQHFNWDGTIRWSYRISSTTTCSHHDFKVLPNGNILVLVWQLKTPTEQTTAGRGPSLAQTATWSESILELQPSGTSSATIVWQWNLWDHLIQDSDATKANFGVVADHPELVNLNFIRGGLGKDWIHLNAIDYNPDLDQILVSSFCFDEVWVLDHSTTTAEAATHNGGHLGMGGDLIYRWGNPEAYGRGTPLDKQLFHQHNAQWIRPGLPNAGKILVYNNGDGRPGLQLYSSIDMIDPPMNQNGSYQIFGGNPYGPATYFWEYTAPVRTDLYSQLVSGVHIMPNGSMMICEGLSGQFWEVDTNGKRVWKYINPISQNTPLTQGQNPAINSVFRCTYYPPSYSAFTGRTLTPGQELEKQPVRPALCEIRNIITAANAGMYCAGSSITARFTADGIFRKDNMFYFALSDSSGSFANSLIVDSVNSQYVIPFTVTLPKNLSSSTKYRYRIISTDPPAVGSDNGSDVTILPLPNVMFDHPSPYKICNFKAPVRVTASGGTNYQWSDGADSASRLIIQPGRYYVTVSNDAGCERRDSIDIIDIPFLDVKITPTKSTTLCDGMSTGLIASGGQYFRWSTGDTTKLIVVSKQGWYKVTSTDPTGCSGTDSIYITVNPVPSISMDQTGNVSICPGDTVVLTATPASNYYWSTGDTTQSIRVSMGGSYFVSTRNEKDCYGSSTAVIVKMLTPPEKPVIARSENVLSTKSSPPLQWYLNGQPIPGANGYSIEPQQDGNYTVSTEGNGCTSISDVFAFTATSGVEEAAIKPADIRITPNPFTDRIGIHLTSPSRSDYKIECYSVLGEKVATISEGTLEKGDTDINYLFTDADRDGVYFIRIQFGTLTRTFKVVRQ
jgi:hypothetical protein